MDMKPLVMGSVGYAYGVTEKLIRLVSEDRLDWKPSSGKNWMTVGQLLKHLAEACGHSSICFITGNWITPDGVDLSKLSPGEMLLPSEDLPAVSSVEAALQMLAADKAQLLTHLNEVSEDDLQNRTCGAPWDPMQLPLGNRILQMVEHLNSHKAQLFFYLKLQGLPVNTSNLWGM